MFQSFINNLKSKLAKKSKKSPPERSNSFDDSIEKEIDKRVEQEVETRLEKEVHKRLEQLKVKQKQEQKQHQEVDKVYRSQLRQEKISAYDNTQANLNKNKKPQIRKAEIENDERLRAQEQTSRRVKAELERKEQIKNGSIKEKKLEQERQLKEQKIAEQKKQQEKLKKEKEERLLAFKQMKAREEKELRLKKQKLAEEEKARQEKRKQEKIKQEKLEQEQKLKEQKKAKLIELEKREKERKKTEEKLKKAQELAESFKLEFVNQSTPLMIAAENNDVERVRELLTSGANPNVCNRYLETPLIYALKSIKKGPFHEVVKLLLDHGANPHIKSTLDVTAFMYAKSRNDQKSLELLKAHDVDVNEYKKPKSERRPIKKKSTRTIINKESQTKVNSKTNMADDTLTARDIDRSHEFEKHLFDAIRMQIRAEINSLKENLRSNDLGGADEYTNAVLREHRYKQIDQLERQYTKPYFGRIIYRKGKQIKSFYIGERGYDDLIISWTTPAASLFYQKKLGKQNHHTLGTVNVELIRQFDHGKIYDLAVTKSGYYDPVLHQKLGKQSSHQLGEIIETIQAEQDAILRTPKNTPILLQGSAGSGKTTIALHRIPYLLYQYKEIKPEQILFLGPNKLFLNYVEAVLPNIGVENAEQNTLDNWIIERIDPKSHGYSLTDYNENLNIIEKLDTGKKAEIIKRCNIKGSILFKKAISHYLTDYMNYFSNVPDFSFSYKDFSFKVPHTEIKDWFQRAYQSTFFYGRKQKIIQRLAEQFSSSLTRHKFDEEDEKLCKEKFEASIQQFEQQQMKYMDIYQIYFQFISNEKLLKFYAKDCFADYDTLNFFVQSSKYMYTDKEIEYDDLAGLFSIFAKLHGKYGVPEHKQKNKKNSYTTKRYQYLVIDEVQDYNPFQIEIIKDVTEKGSMLLVGDLGQSIHQYRGISSWDQLRQLFNENLLYQELSTSYRSTNEITDFANKIIQPYSDGLYKLSKPVGRNGSNHSFVYSNTEQMRSDLSKTISKIQEKGSSNIGIITKSRTEATSIYSQLIEIDVGAELLLDHNNRFEGGIVVLPVYLSKGLEFEAVIVTNVTKDQYKNSHEDRKLLYVATTRALNELFIVTEDGNMSELID
ncbi:UvrD-helicase domain-containing protein [Gracilibacillus massiliensis]|uniref:UvrD-helicase domain-containing protein n=1 Tax=Gracilibacillus massiliensis TaxID=1564956 RepID=UPI00071D6202|nr:UvrD-helicase domain-containing protein [Gracilibacillus massiliensis]